MFRGFYLPSLHSVSLCALEFAYVLKKLVHWINTFLNTVNCALVAHSKVRNDALIEKLIYAKLSRMAIY